MIEKRIGESRYKDPICHIHGTPKRRGPNPGVWFCGRLDLPGYEPGLPCNLQTEKQREAGLRRWEPELFVWVDEVTGEEVFDDIG